MRVVIAPDSFKGSITAAEAARALAAGWGSVRGEDELICRPIADGGEGTLEAFAAAVSGAQRISVLVRGPRGHDVQAQWLLLPATADAPAGTGVVELAGTSGIEMLGDDLAPWDADTVGFGQAIAAAIEHGVSALILGVGSSASTDAGVGLLAALGARFLDQQGEPVTVPGLRGLPDIATVDLDGLVALPPGGARVLTDVTNPLLGNAGAAAIFGPQKGLDPAETAAADVALARVAAIIEAAAGAGQLSALPGAGAAGGAGFGLLAWGAELVPGAPAVAELVGLREVIAGADAVITGEGSFDGQSAAGKAPAHVAGLAAEVGVPVLLVAGRITPDADTAEFATAISLTELAGSGRRAQQQPETWIHTAGAHLAGGVDDPET